MRMPLCVVVLLLFAAPAFFNVVSAGDAKGKPTFSPPFSSSSIWNRKVAQDAEFADVEDAIWGDLTQTPTHLSVDLISVIFEDPKQPLVDFRLSRGWNFPARSRSKGRSLFQRRLSPKVGTDLRYPPNGNALYVIINPATGLADEGVGAWRNPGGDFLMLYDDDKLHRLDVVNGTGLTGPRGSGLSGLGGTVRVGELKSGINHALAVCLSSRRYSKKKHFIWPASRGDAFASNWLYGYLGTNPAYTMGTLLAIPPSIDLKSIKWRTRQGKILAVSAQQYGWYIVDSGTGEAGGHSFKFSMERQAASTDLGLTIDPKTNDINVDPRKMDAEGVASDIQKILHLVKAVTNNRR